MARVVYAAGALEDLERLIDFLEAREPALSGPVLARITEAVSMLGAHPFLGRSIEHGLRELVISRGKTGYVALYEFREVEDVALVLPIRHQREAGAEAADE